MSLNNALKTAKTGAIFGGLIGAALGAAAAVAAVGLLGGVAALGIAATVGISALGVGLGALKFGAVGAAIGGLLGAFTKDKASELVDVQTPSGRVISVPAQTLEQAHAQEAARFQDRVEQSRGGSRFR